MQLSENYEISFLSKKKKQVHLKKEEGKSKVLLLKYKI